MRGRPLAAHSRSGTLAIYSDAVSGRDPMSYRTVFEFAVLIAVIGGVGVALDRFGGPAAAALPLGLVGYCTLRWWARRLREPSNSQ